MFVLVMHEGGFTKTYLESVAYKSPWDVRIYILANLKYLNLSVLYHIWRNLRAGRPPVIVILYFGLFSKATNGVAIASIAVVKSYFVRTDI